MIRSIIVVTILLANALILLCNQANLDFGLIDEARGLCEHINDPIGLFNATSAFIESLSASRRVTLVSYSTPSIYEYAAYSLAINAMYARKRVTGWQTSLPMKEIMSLMIHAGTR